MPKPIKIIVDDDDRFAAFRIRFDSSHIVLALVVKMGLSSTRPLLRLGTPARSENRHRYRH